MTVFFAVAVVLVLAALGWVLVPLMRAQIGRAHV